MVVGLPRTNTLPANYTFFKKEFDKFISVSSERAEVQAVLSELCVSLEQFWKRPQDNSTTKAARKSIVDPCSIKVKGPQTTSTSSKVGRTAPRPKTAMVERILSSKPNGNCVGKTKRTKHTCPICRREGHHSRTCRDVLVEENRDRSDMFFIQLMDSNKFDKYLAAMAVRVSTQFAGMILHHVKTSEKTRQVFLASQGAGSCSKNN